MITEYIGGILVALASAGGAVLVAWLKMRGDREVSIPAAYQGLLQEMKEWTGQQLEQRDQKINELQHDVSELQRAVRLWKRKFYEAVEHIRSLRSAAPDRAVLPPVPESIRDDVDV